MSEADQCVQLLERDSVLEQVDDALAGGREGRGRVLLIEGSAGIRSASVQRPRWAGRSDRRCSRRPQRHRRTVSSAWWSCASRKKREQRHLGSLGVEIAPQAGHSLLIRRIVVRRRRWRGRGRSGRVLAQSDGRSPRLHALRRNAVATHNYKRQSPWHSSLTCPAPAPPSTGVGRLQRRVEESVSQPSERGAQALVVDARGIRLKHNCGRRLHGRARELGIDRVRLSGRPRMRPMPRPRDLLLGGSRTPVVPYLLDYLGGVAAGDLRRDRRIGYGTGGALDREPQLDSRRDRLRVELHRAARSGTRSRACPASTGT